MSNKQSTKNRCKNRCTKKIKGGIGRKNSPTPYRIYASKFVNDLLEFEKKPKSKSPKKPKSPPKNKDK